MKDKINKKREQEDRRRKKHEQYIKLLSVDKKYNQFRKTILKKREKEIEERKIKEATKIKEKTKETKSQQSTFVEEHDLVKKTPFINCYNFILKGLTEENGDELTHTCLLYCNFDMNINNNMGKYNNLAVDIVHPYYRDIILFVYENSEKWKNIIINKKMKHIKKVMTFDKFEEMYYTDHHMKAFTNIYDLFIFDSSIRAKRYSLLVSKIKKNKKAYSSIRLCEDTFFDDFTNTTKKSYTDLKKGTSNSIPVGYLSLGVERLYENVKAIEAFMLAKYAQKKIVVISIYLKFVDIAIPLYVRSCHQVIVNEDVLTKSI